MCKGLENEKKLMKKRYDKIFDQLKSDLMQFFNYNIIMYHM